MGSRIAIVGMAAAFPRAANLREFWTNVVNGVDAIESIPEHRLNNLRPSRLPPGHPAHIACDRGGFLPAGLSFDPTAFGVLPINVRNGDPDQFLALEIVAAALRDAGVDEKNPARRRTDVILGRGGYMTNKMSEVYLRAEAIQHLLRMAEAHFTHWDSGELARFEDVLYESLPENDPESLITCMPNIVASRVANRLNLEGAAFTVDAACASSLIAVEHAISGLRAGRCDLAIAGGLHLTQTPGFWMVFDQLGALSPTGVIRPFDQRADGLVPGEGAGAVVLKRLEDALRDGDAIYALIAGVGSSSDGRATEVINPSSTGQTTALLRAYEDADLSPDTIGFLEAHGTATVTGDAAEIETLKRVFGPPPAGYATRAMGSVKSMIGHTMPAAGVAGLIRAALALSNKILPPSLHCEEPHPSLIDCPFYVNDRVRPWIHDGRAHPRRAAVNAFGFGGINAHVILEEVEPSSTGEGSRARVFFDALYRPDELLLFSSDQKGDLAAALRGAAESLKEAHDDSALVDLATALAQNGAATRAHRVAIVAKDAREASGLAEECADALAQDRAPSSSPTVFWSGAASDPGRIAFVFPGVGFPGLIGSYPDHLMTLCLHFPLVREQFDAIENRDGSSEDPWPTSLLFVPPRSYPEALKKKLRQRIAAMTVDMGAAPSTGERNVSASGVTLTNWASWLLLQRVGIRPDMICGQSQGEIAALAASGVVSIHEVLPRFWTSLALASSYAGDGHLAFAAAPAETLEPFFKDLESVSIAIHIAPNAQVLGGEGADLEILIDRLRAERIMAQGLPYPPIHTPLLRHLRQDVLDQVGGDLDFSQPQIPIYSAITADPFPTDAEGIRALALSNLDRPVHFWQTIRRMHDDGARIFVQVGGGSLAANIHTVLAEQDSLEVALDVEDRHPVSQLHRLLGSLFARGVPIDAAPLHLHRGHAAVPYAPQPTQSGFALPLRLDWPFFRPKEGVTQRTSAPRPEPARHVSALAPRNTETGPLPLLGEVEELTPGERIRTTYIFDLEEARFLWDHALINARDVKPVEDCLPLVPMTVLMEMMAESGACLVPGLGLVGFEKVRAVRWVALSGPERLPVRVEVSVLGTDTDTQRVRLHATVWCEGEERASATLLFAPQYAATLSLSFAAGSKPRPWPFDVSQIYEDRYLFHGPMFHVVTGLGELDERGSAGELTLLSPQGLFSSIENPQLLIDPVALDGAAQIVGLCLLGTEDRLVMPIDIEALELYRPTPPPGTRIQVRQQLTSLDIEQRTIRSDFEAIAPDGGVWFRAKGYRAWLLDYSPRIGKSQRLPRQYLATADVPVPGLPDGAAACLILREDLRHVNMDWAMRLSLQADEIQSMKALPTGEQWQRLCRFLTSKDAVRSALKKSSNTPGMLHPAEVHVVVEPGSKAAVLGPRPAITYHLDVASTATAAIAVASPTPIAIALMEARGDADTAQLDCARQLWTRVVGSREGFHAPQLLADGTVEIQRRDGGTSRIFTARHSDFIIASTSLPPRSGEHPSLEGVEHEQPIH